MTLVDPENRTGKYILNAQGDPVEEPDLLAWAQWMETAERRIAQDMDEGEGAARIVVSTIFLGLDHNFYGDGPAILWETMVFGGLLNGETRRYTSRDDAFRGHQEMCRQVAATMERP